ncbi:MAG: DUF1653 domain-containing protein [Nanoarchaeota archaeon]|nr:DUF1653 domain-containing protein [Nanoarchaeota archaeon]
MDRIKPGVYKHYKGKLYLFLFEGFDSDNLEPVVVYQGLYNSEEFGDRPIWVRPKKEFIDDKEGVKRFEWVQETE